MEIQLVAADSLPQGAVNIGGYNPDGLMPKVEDDEAFQVGEIFDLYVTAEAVWMEVHPWLGGDHYGSEVYKVLGIENPGAFARSEVEDRVARARECLAEWEETLAAVKRF